MGEYYDFDVFKHMLAILSGLLLLLLGIFITITAVAEKAVQVWVRGIAGVVLALLGFAIFVSAVAAASPVA